MRTLRRIQRRHVLIVALLGLGLAWYFQVWPFAPNPVPACIYDAQTHKPKTREACRPVLSKEWALMRDTFCKSGKCDVPKKDDENQVDADGMSALQKMFDGITPDWAVPKLFPVDNVLTIPDGRKVDLIWEEGANQVLSGHVVLCNGTVALELMNTCRTNQQDMCKRTLKKRGDNERIVVTTRRTTILTLHCAVAKDKDKDKECKLLLTSGSVDLSSDGACKSPK